MFTPCVRRGALERFRRKQFPRSRDESVSHLSVIPYGRCHLTGDTCRYIEAPSWRRLGVHGCAPAADYVTLLPFPVLRNASINALDGYLLLSLVFWYGTLKKSIKTTEAHKDGRIAVWCARAARRGNSSMLRRRLK
ncbi:hypothetical protein EVAR_10844_1 [Eumeta japonica]|uniref:Uncharacterized protein n=1 Tax=Eumeta variegata TaxID=151549 RepID=A0A4C1URT0_EUMVA|nr:hypothetical protein EVAR_10844_1 [Eumeta japonica]